MYGHRAQNRRRISGEDDRMMNETIQTLCSRRSCRRYKSDPVPQELLEQVLRAGTYAASGKNLQSAKIVVIRDKATRDKLMRMNAAILGTPDRDPFFGAPMLLLVLADPSSYNCVYDGSLVMGNLMNAAAALGLGSCWINRARQEFESEEGKALLKEWGIEGEWIGIGHCILGWPDGPLPAAAPRKPDYIHWVG